MITDKGFLPPRMATGKNDDISSPALRLMFFIPIDILQNCKAAVYNAVTNCIEFLNWEWFILNNSTQNIFIFFLFIRQNQITI